MSTIDPRILSQIAAHDFEVEECKLALSGLAKREKTLTELEHEYASDAAEAKARHDEFKLQLRQYELDVAEFRRQAKVHLGHLDQITDSREYRALNEEIRYIERQISDKEELALAVMEEAEKAEKLREESQQILTDKRLEFLGQRGEMAQQVKQQKEKMRQREAAKESFYASIPESVRAYYDRRGKRQSMPVVWLWESNACGYCHHRLTPQRRLEVMRSEGLVICESCGRVIVAAPIVGAHSLGASGDEAGSAS